MVTLHLVVWSGTNQEQISHLENSRGHPGTRYVVRANVLKKFFLQLRNGWTCRVVRTLLPHTKVCWHKCWINLLIEITLHILLDCIYEYMFWRRFEFSGIRRCVNFYRCENTRLVCYLDLQGNWTLVTTKENSGQCEKKDQFLRQETISDNKYLQKSTLSHNLYLIWLPTWSTSVKS